MDARSERKFLEKLPNRVCLIIFIYLFIYFYFWVLKSVFDVRRGLRVMLKRRLVSFLCLLKIDVNFKITIRFVMDHYYIFIQW
jgi:hypothetical protein